MASPESDPKGHRYQPAHVSEVATESQTTVTEYKRHPVYSPSEWLLESISSILALALVLAIALIFWYMDNKPLSAWNARVSLNATVSILTTACTTALMHGVSTFIGQSKWLHFKDKSSKLADFETFDGASRGVWGSILLLTTVKWNIATIGAFITILRLAFAPFAQQVVSIEQRDIISVSDIATFGYAHNYQHPISSGLANSGPSSFPQDPGMQSAIIQGLYGLNATESFNCPGACRWPESYTSIGFKAECRNVTQETLKAATCEAFYMNTTSIIDSKPGSEFLDPFPEITRFAIFRSSPDGNFHLRNINITDCSLFLTAYEYKGANANGSDFLVTKREVDFGVKNPWKYSDQSVSSIKNYIYTNESTGGDVHIPALQMNYASLTTLENFLKSPSIVVEWVEGNFVNTDLGLAAALMGDVDINDRFDRMATSMTDYLRYGPNTQSARGEIIRSEAYVSIRWGYFVVPIVTEGFAILFAILSIFNNRQSRRVPLWKSSTLAVLACQHEERLGLLRAPGKDLDEIEDEAKKAKVRLE
ncbi:hypothetical protein N7457_000438 [Penicillium paradoxum]|uniref:uncharacterized protein n=1 Tax=Penicillium paradoxum TaxID=176176 RepID=UPI0025469A42|nr:uncharacterized protein N7457_000438 [Penicillium paradoxum]KAJ5793839.1 hypothetical protein N7457_000438 [Penicillium paradoxum]